jgi:hypothetical protein
MKSINRLHGFFALSNRTRSLIAPSEIPKLLNKPIEAQKDAPEQPHQAQPWPVKIFTDIVATQQTSEYRR